MVESKYRETNTEQKAEEEVDVPMLYSRKIMQWHQMWPSDGQEATATFLIRPAIVLILAISLASLFALSAVNAVIAGAWEWVNAYVAYTLSIVVCVCVYLMRVLSHEQTEAANAQLLDFERFGRPESLRGTCRILNRLVISVYVYVNVAIMMQLTNSFWGREAREKNFRAEGLQMWCGYADMMLGWDLTYLQTVLISLYMAGTCFLVMQGSAGFSINFFETTIYITLKVDHLNGLLETMFDAEHEEQYREQLAECARYLTHVVDVANVLNSSYMRMWFVYFLLMAIIFGLLANLVLEKHTLPDIIHLAGWISLFSLACTGGQLLINASEKLCVAVYNSRWYDMDVGIQKDVLFLLQLAQAPIEMQAGPFVVLSFPLLATIINTAYSYLTLVRSATD